MRLTPQAPAVDKMAEGCHAASVQETITSFEASLASTAGDKLHAAMGLLRASENQRPDRIEQCFTWYPYLLSPVPSRLT
eukprot:1335729-Pyramimonas_sp.AAC.1